MKILEYLQLFAEAAVGDTTQFTGEEQAAAAPEATGENSPSDAGMEQDSRDFDDLVRGKYKKPFEDRVRQVLQKRLKDHKTLQSRLQALDPVLTVLGQRCGVDPADAQALARAVEALPQLPDRAARAEQQQKLWAEQAARTKALYPGFDLGQALQNAQFVKLLQNDVPVQTAYEVLHKDRLLPAALAHTAQAVEQKLANSLASMGDRPGENGLGEQNAAAVFGNVSQMTRKDRADIIRRVRKGETIRF